MPKFRKRPIEVAAVQWYKQGDDPDVVPYKQADKPWNEPCGQCDHIYLGHGWIATLEGGHIVCPGDWLITGVQGERYPCKPDIFEETYESVGRGDFNPERLLSRLNSFTCWLLEECDRTEVPEGVTLAVSAYPDVMVHAQGAHWAAIKPENKKWDVWRGSIAIEERKRHDSLQDSVNYFLERI